MKIEVDQNGDLVAETGGGQRLIVGRHYGETLFISTHTARGALILLPDELGAVWRAIRDFVGD